MKTKKMSLANIKDKLSRVEMKKIMAGSGSGGCDFGHPSCSTDQECWQVNKGNCNGQCCSA